MSIIHLQDAEIGVDHFNRSINREEIIILENPGNYTFQLETAFIILSITDHDHSSSGGSNFGNGTYQILIHNIIEGASLPQPISNHDVLLIMGFFLGGTIFLGGIGLVLLIHFDFVKRDKQLK